MTGCQGVHRSRCQAGTKACFSRIHVEVPIRPQLGSIRIDNAARAQITVVLSASDRPVTVDPRGSNAGCVCSPWSTPNQPGVSSDERGVE
jgi:hypothetical protein